MPEDSPYHIGQALQGLLRANKGATCCNRDGIRCRTYFRPLTRARSPKNFTGSGKIVLHIPPAEPACPVPARHVTRR